MKEKEPSFVDEVLKEFDSNFTPDFLADANAVMYETKALKQFISSKIIEVGKKEFEKGMILGAKCSADNHKANNKFILESTEQYISKKENEMTTRITEAEKRAVERFANEILKSNFEIERLQNCEMIKFNVVSVGVIKNALKEFE